MAESGVSPEILRGLSEVQFWSVAARAARLVDEEGVTPQPQDWASVERIFLLRFNKALQSLDLEA